MPDLINKLNASDAAFDENLRNLLAWSDDVADHVEQTVRDILKKIKTEGDNALLELTQKFDRFDIANASELEISKEQLELAWNTIPAEQQAALQSAADRIRRYHEKQAQSSWQFQEDDGTILGQKITALDSVGLYVPGGKAAYPSSVLMAAIPAKVAGVKQIVMVSPTPDGELNQTVLAAAKIAGVDRVIRIGGAQAVAALAYGTELVPKVDKIVGPGNIFVATAKREVFGLVDIDMIAGPSEILVVSDGTGNPDWVAMDLCSQAEHDEIAQAILLCDDDKFLLQVENSLKKIVPALNRSEITASSLKNRGALIKVANLDQAIELVNKIAPEHLELAVEDPEAMLPAIRHAGAIFLGHYTSEATFHHDACSRHQQSRKPASCCTR